jgi:Fe-S-cluster containining protein
VRPGASFRCFGDGLCCTDIHALGILTRSEVSSLRKFNKLAVVYSEDIDGHALRPVDNRCLFLGSNELCGLHAQYGAEAKPMGCRRFPYGLVTTPFGGRITTEHRCTCRTLGERPPLSIEDADASLRDRAGRLEVDKDAPKKIDLTWNQSVWFADYVEIEARLIERLNAGERAEDVLAAKVLPPLSVGDRGWPTIAVEHIETRDSTAGGEAFGWFGDALLELSAGHTPPQRPRPWAAAFERAAARGGEQTAEAVYNDWIADELWGFRWVEWGPFDVARAELATRLACARLIQKRVERAGVTREDQAAAEAVMVCELASEGADWPKTAAAIATDPSPADPLPLPESAMRAPRRSAR